MECKCNQYKEWQLRIPISWLYGMITIWKSFGLGERWRIGLIWQFWQYFSPLTLYILIFFIERIYRHLTLNGYYARFVFFGGYFYASWVYTIIQNHATHKILVFCSPVQWSTIYALMPLDSLLFTIVSFLIISSKHPFSEHALLVLHIVFGQNVHLQ